MSRRPLSRRSFLRGIGGTTLALPLLQVGLERSARAAAVAPTRYVVMFAGISAGRVHTANMLAPGAYGPAYQVTDGLRPLASRGVQERVAVVSNLRIPRSTKAVADAPGGMPIQWHPTSMGPLISGQRFTGAHGERSPRPMGPTSDQYVAAAFGARGVHYRVQAEGYEGSPERGILSWKQSGDVLAPNTPVVNARTAYDAMVSGLEPLEADAAAELERRRARRKSAVDLALGKQALLERVGREDRQRLERHFDELRALETRLATPTDGGELCVPGYRPSDTTTVVDAYTNEAGRWRELIQIIKTGFLCGERVATLCVTHAMSFLNTKQLIPSAVDTDVHETTHGSVAVAHTEVVQWHVDVFAKMVEVFRDTTDVDGRSLLDNTAIVYLFEGGLGPDPEESKPESAHSGDNMGVLAAGLAAGGAGGVHVDGGKRHPASVLLTAMNNVGVSASRLGEIGSTIPELAR